MTKEKENEKIRELDWIRLITPDHIPSYLIEQIKRREFEVEDWFALQRSICLREVNGSMSLNPMSHLYLLATKDKLPKGALWFTIDTLSKSIHIQLFSVDKEYQFEGAVGYLKDFIKKILLSSGLKKVYWVTDCPNHSKTHGFEQSRGVLMKYELPESGGESAETILNGDNDGGRKGHMANADESLDRDSGALSTSTRRAEAVC